MLEKLFKSRELDRQVIKIKLDKIKYGKFQPRFIIDDHELEELVESIREVGVLQPVVVRPGGDYYELIAGERRVRASMLAGLQEISAVVCNLSDQEAEEVALIENIQRSNLHFLEEAEGFQNLIEHFHLTQTEVAKRMGLSQSAVANKLRLLKLDKRVRDKLYQLKLSERHARALLELESTDDQLQLLEKAEKEDIKVREWEEIIREKKDNISREIKKSKKQKQKIKPMIKDLRLFINSLEKGIKVLQEAGFDVHLYHRQNEEGIRIIIEVLEQKQYDKAEV
jgi:ParB family chromosome partitioning protein